MAMFTHPLGKCGLLTCALCPMSIVALSLRPWATIDMGTGQQSTLLTSGCVNIAPLEKGTERGKQDD
jgi:hypothetical protein